MKVLVTGGAGYIGSHTVLELLGNTHDVLIVDDFSNSNPVVLDRMRQLSNRNFAFSEMNVLDGDRLKQSFLEFRPDAVIHFAGLKVITDSVADPLNYYSSNMQGAFRLLEAMEASGCKQLVFSSTANIYGEPQYLPVDENHRIDPSSPYGRTKYFIEELMRDWAYANAGRHVISLRYFNPIGAHASGLIGEDSDDIPPNLMPYISQVAVGELDELKVFGNDYPTRDGTGVRDFIHVLDLAGAHVAALEKVADIDGFDAINVGTGKGTSVLELVAAFERVTGKTIPFSFAPRRPNDMPDVHADVKKAQTVMGWKARFDIDQMCRDTWNWQSKNPKGFAS